MSNVTCFTFALLATQTISFHARGGIPRRFHVDTVGAGRPIVLASAPVPPSASIICSGVIRMPTI